VFEETLPYRYMYEAKRIKTAAGTARTVFPFRVAALEPRVLVCVDEPELPVAVVVNGVLGLRVEETTGEVGEMVTVAVPTSTVK